MAPPSEGKGQDESEGPDNTSLIPFVSTGSRPGKWNDGGPAGRNDVERTLIIPTKRTSTSLPYSLRLTRARSDAQRWPLSRTPRPQRGDRESVFSRETEFLAC